MDWPKRPPVAGAGVEGLFPKSPPPVWVPPKRPPLVAGCVGAVEPPKSPPPAAGVDEGPALRGKVQYKPIITSNGSKDGGDMACKAKGVFRWKLGTHPALAAPVLMLKPPAEALADRPNISTRDSEPSSTFDPGVVSTGAGE